MATYHNTSAARGAMEPLATIESLDVELAGAYEAYEDAGDADRADLGRAIDLVEAIRTMSAADRAYMVARIRCAHAARAGRPS